jgi:two-component sensor histidine kinase
MTAFWGRLNSLTLNQRIMLIVLVALLPISMFSLGQGYRAREHLNALAGERLSASANATAAAQREGFNTARRMLARAAIDVDIMDATTACAGRIKGQLVAQNVVVNLARSDANGRVTCSGLPFTEGLSFAGEDWWQKGRDARRLSLSAPTIGQISQRRVIIAMNPFYDASGQFTGAITAGVDVTWLEGALTDLRLSQSAVVGIADANGNILMHSKDVELGQIEVGAQGKRFRLTEAMDGSTWVYQVAPIFGRDLFIVFAEPQRRLLSVADEFWVQNLMLPILTMFFASFAVWWGIQLFVLQWLDKLSLKAQRIALGTYVYDERLFANAAPEIQDFAKTLHQMADDIDRQKADLNRSLQHSRVLGREINHRVKNNLQIILSLLHMQAAQTRQPEARHILNQTLARMGAVSASQRLTYEENEVVDGGRVDMRALLAALAQQLRGTFSAEPHKIEMQCEIDALPADQAIPIALIIVEAVSNAMVHAFQGEAGTIHISLEQRTEDTLLTIKDYGKGFDSKTAYKKLGMDLIDALVIQLNGQLAIDAQPGTGTVITVTFS